MERSIFHGKIHYKWLIPACSPSFLTQPWIPQFFECPFFTHQIGWSHWDSTRFLIGKNMVVYRWCWGFQKNNHGKWSNKYGIEVGYRYKMVMNMVIYSSENVIEQSEQWCFNMFNYLTLYILGLTQHQTYGDVNQQKYVGVIWFTVYGG